MENVIHRLTLDLARPGSGACLTVRRGDSARTLVVSLSQNGRPYKIDDTAMAVFSARKSDGVPLFNSCTIQGNAVHYAFTGQTTNVLGTVDCEIRLYSSGMELLTTAAFSLIVEDTIHQEGDIPDSSPEYTALTELIEKGTALVESLEGLAEELVLILEELRETHKAALDAAERAEDAAERAEKAAERAEDAAGRADGSIEGLASTEYVDAAIAKLREDINYKPITFTSISIRPAVVQLGQTVEDAVVSWALSKAPIKQTVGAVSVGIKEREYVIPGVYSKGVTVTATDERGATAMKSVAISFFNAVYYGKVSGWGVPTDAALQAMPHKLQDGRTLTIQADAGEMEHLIYACPSRMGTPEFWANGFMGGFERLGTIQHCNAAGYTEDYDVWISGSAGLSGVTVTVK